jgi:DASS family divalent anion:Na+ symporter
MGYGFLATDLLLAPAIPSLTARSGGIIYPVLSSVAKAFGSEPNNHPRKLGSFLILTAFHGSVITSAMFLTSMAGNPLAANIVAKAGVNLTWGTWAIAASIPGILSLLILPLILYKFYPPEIKQTPDAKIYARQKLNELGKFSLDEALMLCAFIVLIILWIFGGLLQVNATTAALIGLSGLILCKVLSWEDIIKEKSAWDTLIWFSVLIMIASFLNTLGLTTWFSQLIVQHLHGICWEAAYVVLSAVYFFSHYFFASNVAHIGSMFAPFFFLSISLGTPPMLSALTFSFFSSLFGGLTHYGCGPAPIFFGSGYVKIGDWWKFGLVFGIINFIIWMFLGGAWWKILGLF